MKKKIYLITFIICAILICLHTVVVAGVDIDNIDKNKPIAGTNMLKTLGNTTYSVIFIFGIAISVITLGIIGIKYMLGSVEEKAEYKKSLLPYLIGAILLFGASGLAQILYNFANS